MITFGTLRTQHALQALEEQAAHYRLYEQLVESFMNDILTEDASGHPKIPSANPFHALRQGAHEYFNASPEEQAKIHKEAKRLYPHKMFTDEASNPKLAKNGEKMPEYHTKGLFLAPAKSSGHEVCAGRSAECTAACLGTESGRSKMGPVKQSRVNRTNFMFDHPKHFYAKLDHEIHAAKKAAGKKGQKLAVRLNGTSDLPHEHLAPHLFQKHHDVQFYDYTKLTGRPKHKDMPKNYHLTVSSTGLNHFESNWKQVRGHLDRGGVAAMSFKVRPGKKAGPNGRGGREPGKLPTHVVDHETGKKYRVIDGDEHDHRHLDKKVHGIPDHEGVIAGLRLKTAGGWSEEHLKKAGNFAVDVHHTGVAHALHQNVHPNLEDK